MNEDTVHLIILIITVGAPVWVALYALVERCIKGRRK